jgi:hypothetical protein
LSSEGIFEANFKIKILITDDVIGSWSVDIQRWARDIVISLWADLSTIVSARDATIHDSTGAGIPAAEFLRLLDEAEDDQAALRWAVTLNERGRLAAQLQGLPASAAALNGKPSYKR